MVVDLCSTYSGTMTSFRPYSKLSEGKGGRPRGPVGAVVLSVRKLTHLWGRPNKVARDGASTNVWFPRLLIYSATFQLKVITC